MAGLYYLYCTCHCTCHCRLLNVNMENPEIEKLLARAKKERADFEMEREAGAQSYASQDETLSPELLQAIKIGRASCRERV